MRYSALFSKRKGSQAVVLKVVPSNKVRANISEKGDERTFALKMYKDSAVSYVQLS